MRRLRRRVVGVARAGWETRTTSARIGVSFAAPLAICAALGHPADGALTTQGAFVAVYARHEPYRRRLRVMTGVGIAIALAVAIGTLVGPVHLLVPFAAGLMAFSGSLLGTAWDIGRPREFLLVLSLLAVSRIPGGAEQVPHRVLLVLAGAAVVIAIAMAGALTRPRAPEERALRAFWLRLADLLDAMGGEGTDDARRETLVAAGDARRTMTRAGHRRGDGDRLFGIALAGEAALDATLGLVVRDCPTLDPRWSAAARHVACTLRDPHAAAAPELPDEPPEAFHGDRFAQAMRRAFAASDPAALAASTIVPFRRRRDSPRTRLRRAVHPNSLVLPTAVRAGIAVAIGTGIGLAIDPSRGIWVGLTTSAVMQASNVSQTLERTLQRAGGTILGVVLAALVLTADPTVAEIAVALAVLQTLAQATTAAAYGVATFFTTPIALLIVDIGAPGTPAGSLVGARVEDTLIGCAVGLSARRLLWPRTAATRLGAAQGAAIEAVRDVLHAALTRFEAPDGIRVRRARRKLQAELLNLRAVQQDAFGDLLLSGREAEGRWRATTAVEHLAYAAMAFGAPPDRRLAARDQLDPLEDALRRLAAIADGHRAPQDVDVPELPDHPATQRSLMALRDALGPGEIPDSTHEKPGSTE